MSDTFRAEPILLLPILLCLVVGVLCTSLVLRASVDLYAVTPFPETVAGSFANGIYFVILALVGASLLYLLLKRKSVKLITLITGIALTAAAFLLSVFYLYAVFSILKIPYESVTLLVLGTVIAAVTDIVIFRGRGAWSSVAVLALGGALGAFLGLSIPTLSAVLILVFLAFYDIYAVYRGPVGKIAQAGLEQFRGLNFSFRNYEIGLGDLTFYSMLVSLVLTNAGRAVCLVSTAGVLTGAFLTLRMLEKRGIFPGLPLPVALGLVPLIVWLFL